MKKIFLLIPVMILALSGCNTNQSQSNKEVYDVKWVTPVGAPTLAFYDQGENENWLSTDSPADVIPGAFVANNYDAIVFDGLTGLNLINKNSSKSHYALARWINQLSFYLVSTKHTAEEAIAVDAKIDAFVQTGAASQALRRLASDSVKGWAIGELTNVTYEDGVNKVQANLTSSDTAFDYYLLAEPVYTLTKAALAKKGVTLNTIKDLQNEWYSAYGAYIPSAGLFINTDSLNAHPDEMKAFINALDSRVDDLVDNPTKAKEALLAFESKNDGNVQKQFGIGLPIVNQLDTLQATNKLGFMKDPQTTTSNMKYANGFAGALQGDSCEPVYLDNLFVNI